MRQKAKLGEVLEMTATATANLLVHTKYLLIDMFLSGVMQRGQELSFLVCHLLMKENTLNGKQ